MSEEGIREQDVLGRDLPVSVGGHFPLTLSFPTLLFDRYGRREWCLKVRVSSWLDPTYLRNRTNFQISELHQRELTLTRIPTSYNLYDTLNGFQNRSLPF